MSRPGGPRGFPRLNLQRLASGGNRGIALDWLPGHHEYKFVMDGASCREPGSDGTNHDCPRFTPNHFDPMTRVSEVKA